MAHEESENDGATNPSKIDPKDTAGVSSLLKNIGYAATIISTIFGLAYSALQLKDKAEVDKRTAEITLQTELAKNEIAKRQLELQQAEFLRQHSEHVQDANRQSINADSEHIRALIAALFSKDSPSEATLAMLSPFAQHESANSKAIGSAVQAKLLMTTSMSEVELAFRLLSDLDMQSLPLLPDINRDARRRYDATTDELYLIWMANAYSHPGALLNISFDQTASARAEVARAGRLKLTEYDIARLNQAPGIPLRSWFAREHKDPAELLHDARERIGTTQQVIDELITTRAAVKEVMDRSGALLIELISRDTNRSASIILNDCYLGKIALPIRRNGKYPALDRAYVDRYTAEALVHNNRASAEAINNLSKATTGQQPLQGAPIDVTLIFVKDAGWFRSR